MRKTGQFNTGGQIAGRLNPNPRWPFWVKRVPPAPVRAAVDYTVAVNDVVGLDFRSLILGLAPLVYLRLDEATPGTGTAADSSGNAHDGTYVGSPTSATGLLDTDSDAAVDLDGSTQWVTSSSPMFPLASQRTFIALVKRDAITDADTIWGSDRAVNSTLLELASGSNSIRFFPASGGSPVTWTNALAAATRGLVVLTFDGNTKSAELFVDGVSQGAQTAASDYPGNGNYMVGAYRTGIGPFAGIVDEFAVIDGIVSAGDIAKLAAAVTSVTDHVTVSLGHNVQVDDTVTPSDTISIGYGPGLADSITTSDSQAFDRGLGLADTTALADAQAFEIHLEIDDTLSLADNAAANRGIVQNVDDTLSLTDLAALEQDIVIGDTLALDDLATPELHVGTVNIDDTVTPSDALTFDRGLAIADTVTPSDAQAFDRTWHIDDTLPVDDQATPAVGHNLAIDDTLGLADNASTEVFTAVNINDSVTPSDALVFEEDIVIADPLALTDAQAFARDIHIDDTATLADDQTISLGHNLAIDDTLGLADNATTATGKSAQIDDTLSLADAQAFARDIHIDETSTPANDAVAFSREIHLADTVTPDDAQTRDHATVDDTVGLTDDVVTEHGIDLRIDDTVPITDDCEPQRGIDQIVLIDDLLALTDQAVARLVRGGTETGYIDFTDLGAFGETRRNGRLDETDVGPISETKRGDVSRPRQGAIS